MTVRVLLFITHKTNVNKIITWKCFMITPTLKSILF